MILTFRPLADLSIFTTPPDSRKPNRFRSTYQDTLQKLDYELARLDATEVYIQVALADPTRHIRLDGSLHANAVVTHPGCALTVVTPEYGTMVYAVDRFERRYSGDPPSWHMNLRAIVLGLEKLRTLDDYGLADRGQQYAGFRELGAGTALGSGMTRAEASKVLAHAAAVLLGTTEVLTGEQAERLYRQAAKLHHPDLGGDAATFARLTEARDLLVTT